MGTFGNIAIATKLLNQSIVSSSVVCDDKSECCKTLQKCSVLVYYHESDVPCLAQKLQYL